MQSKLTVKEVEELQSYLKKDIQQLVDLEQKQIISKKQLIESIRDRVKLLVDAQALRDDKGTVLVKQDVARYCWRLLHDEYNVAYHEGHFYELFSEDLKRNYLESSLSAVSHSHDFSIIDNHPEIGEFAKCSCGQMTINGKLVRLESLEETQQKQREREERKEELKLDKIDELILMRSGNAHHNGKLWLKIYEARRDYPEIRSKLDPLLGDIADLTKAEKGLAAKYETFDSMVDMREKLHLAEILRLNMMMFDYNLAKVASLLDLSAKWMHAVQKRLDKNEDGKELLKIVEQIHKCPGCGWEGYSFWLAENEKRILKGLEVIQPEKKELCCITCKKVMK